MKYTLQEFKADYDEDGKAISGSRKEKIINYVDSMNISNIQKAMLLRKEYSSYDDYNYEIINYIQELNITQNEKKSLLKYLDFKVEGNTISW